VDLFQRGARFFSELLETTVAEVAEKQDRSGTDKRAGSARVWDRRSPSR
jgi:hypothetical protein